MDLVALMRSMGGLAVVLGLLGGALWVVRRFDLALPGRLSAAAGRRVQLVERITIDAKRSVVLLRRDDREHLFVLTPERAEVLETRIVRDEESVPQSRDLTLCANLDGEWYRG